MKTSEVIAIYDAEVEMLKAAGEPAKSVPLQAYRGTRTRIHELLQAENPAPYTELPELEDHHYHDGKAPVDGSLHLTPVGHQKIVSHQRQLPTDEEHIVAAKARSGPDGNFVDTHHYVQREHGRALWEETDRLVKAAGITEVGRS